MLTHVYNVIIYSGVGAPGNCRGVFDGLNAIEKTNLLVFMFSVQLPSAAVYDKHMTMHTSTINKGISLAREFQKHLLDQSHKNGVMDQGNYIKCSSLKKCGENYYHFRYIKHVSHTSVENLCTTTQFPVLPFYGPRIKPYILIELRQHYHLNIDPKLYHGNCSIRQIPCVCVACNNI